MVLLPLLPQELLRHRSLHHRHLPHVPAGSGALRRHLPHHHAHLLPRLLRKFPRPKRPQLHRLRRRTDDALPAVVRRVQLRELHERALCRAGHLSLSDLHAVRARAAAQHAHRHDDADVREDREAGAQGVEARVGEHDRGDGAEPLRRREGRLPEAVRRQHQRQQDDFRGRGFQAGGGHEEEGRGQPRHDGRARAGAFGEPAQARSAEGVEEGEAQGRLPQTQREEEG